MNAFRRSHGAFPDPVYLKTVLEPNFQHSVEHFFSALIEINQAHSLMLVKCRIMRRDHGVKILKALKKLKGEEAQLREYKYRGAEEDLFFFIERKLEGYCGLEIAGQLSVARSRNDVDICLYRMVLRRELLEASLAICRLQEVLLRLASQHTDTVFPVITHTQLAQPTTIAHYLIAAVEFLQRDLDRLGHAFVTVNQCPLGACVATTTGFRIDRHFIARALGFSSALGNAYGSIASVDYLVESVSAIAVLVTNLGRFVQDLLSWCSQDSQMIRLADGFVQCSSIMPQKRNPVALEHLRVLASCALGQCQAVIWGLHNTPFGDVVDAEDDIQPAVRNTFQYSQRVLSLLAEVLSSVEIDKAKALARCTGGEITLTELADCLVRSHRLPFRTAHHIVSQVATALREQPARRKEDSLIEHVCELTARFSRKILGNSIRIPSQQMSQILDPLHFVEIRDIFGGPSPRTVKESLARHRISNRKRTRLLLRETQRLTKYQEELRRVG